MEWLEVRIIVQNECLSIKSRIIIIIIIIIIIRPIIIYTLQYTIKQLYSWIMTDCKKQKRLKQLEWWWWWKTSSPEHCHHNCCVQKQQIKAHPHQPTGIFWSFVIRYFVSFLPLRDQCFTGNYFLKRIESWRFFLQKFNGNIMFVGENHFRTSKRDFALTAWPLHHEDTSCSADLIALMFHYRTVCPGIFISM